MAYLDDILIVGKTMELAISAVSATKLVFGQLGFLIHTVKSRLTPSRVMDYLGFTINSNHLSVTLPEGKRLKLIEACNHLIMQQLPSIRQVASLIGKLVAAFPAAKYGPLHYQQLQRAKVQALKHNWGHFDRAMHLPAEAIAELQCWKANILHCSGNISIESPSIVLD